MLNEVVCVCVCVCVCGWVGGWVGGRGEGPGGKKWTGPFFSPLGKKLTGVSSSLLYRDPVHKNNRPVHLALLISWVLLNTEISVSAPVPEMSATGLAYAADICGLPRKSLRKLAYVRRCPLQIRRCPCLCQSLRTFADIFPYQLGLSFCGHPQLYAS